MDCAPLVTIPFSMKCKKHLNHNNKLDYPLFTTYTLYGKREKLECYKCYNILATPSVNRKLLHAFMAH